MCGVVGLCVCERESSIKTIEDSLFLLFFSYFLFMRSLSVSSLCFFVVLAEFLPAVLPGETCVFTVNKVFILTLLQSWFTLSVRVNHRALY